MHRHWLPIFLTGSDIHTGNIGYRFDFEHISDMMSPELAAIPPGHGRPPYLVSREAWEARPDSIEAKRITGIWNPVILDFGNGKKEHNLNVGTDGLQRIMASSIRRDKEAIQELFPQHIRHPNSSSLSLSR